MKFFGEQMNCALDSFKPYQRPKLSAGGHEGRRLEQERDAAVRCNARLCENLFIFFERFSPGDDRTQL
jgi:hypothetical protein